MAAVSDPTGTGAVEDPDKVRLAHPITNDTVTEWGRPRRDRDRLLALIDRGPDPSSWITQHRQHRGEEPSTDLIVAWAEKWQRDRFAAVEQPLLPHLRARYEVLVLHHGQAPDPAIPPEPAFAVWGEDSPVSADDLAAMPTKGLAKFLRGWQPPTDWRQRDRSSLRGVLNQAV